jgi:hypothetical protein
MIQSSGIDPAAVIRLTDEVPGITSNDKTIIESPVLLLERF